MNRATQTILLNGITLNSSEFIILYDSTPYASKGHIALNLPCDPKDPQDRLLDVLIGRAPDSNTMALGIYSTIVISSRYVCLSWSIWIWKIL